LGKSQFNWSPYFNDSQPETIGDWIEKLHEQYFCEREENPTTLETWRHDYFLPLSRLPEGQPLTESCLKKSLFHWTKPNSRSRQRYALAYARIADLAGLAHDLRELAGDYSTNAVSPRSLPTDETIARFFDSIPDRYWRWIYGVMAAYGVRNHETYFLDFEDYPIAYIDRGKTSERYVWPLYPEWADLWNLRDIVRPECERKTHSGYGNRITQGFEKLDIPFAPYNLRHSWARRSFEFAMDATLAARMLGHSVKVHQEIYRHWIDRDSFDRAYQRLITHPDRPLPPAIISTDSTQPSDALPSRFPTSQNCEDTPSALED
jgi:hypothetical protein